MAAMKKLGLFLPLAIIVLAALVVWRGGGAPAVGVTLQCPDPVQGCRTRLGDREIAVGLDRQVQVLKPFEVWVQAAGVAKVQARFTMKGMDMGFNLYTLKADAQGTFRIRATLPVCVTGRRDWIMSLDIDGTVFEVPFVTTL